MSQPTEHKEGYRLAEEAVARERVYDGTDEQDKQEKGDGALAKTRPHHTPDIPAKARARKGTKRAGELSCRNENVVEEEVQRATKNSTAEQVEVPLTAAAPSQPSDPEVEADPLAGTKPNNKEALAGSPPETGEGETEGLSMDVKEAKAKKPPVPGKAPPVLPWMRAPVEIMADGALPLEKVPCLDSRLKAALQQAGIQELFPVQTAVWRAIAGPSGGARDLCVSSPTGSGKTLAYALPIVQGLATCVVRRLRALVVLPTRDLATQVKEVFDMLAPAVGLSVGLAIGQTSMQAEASQLVVRADASGWTEWVPSWASQQHDSAESGVDILVATPGRLVDHMEETAGFTLEHLQYLVVDETDRLLRQAYQDWLPKVLAALRSHEQGLNVDKLGRPSRQMSLLWSPRRGWAPSRVLKLALSATLTRDPTKIARLSLHRPMLIASTSATFRYKLPPQLQEFKLVCSAEEKPLFLVALLEQLGQQRTLVFTSSVEATHRLFLLLRSFESLSESVVEYSSLQHQSDRSAALENLRCGRASVLVASDAMTRGMDVEGVRNIVSYDVPVYAKTYVHRVGRTARAGKPGSAYTLLRAEEVRYFKGLLRKLDNNFCKDFKMPPAAIENLIPLYTKALESLKAQVEQEEVVAKHRVVKSAQ